MFFESRPSAGDLAVNMALGVTLLWLVRAPLTPIPPIPATKAFDSLPCAP